MTYSEIKEVAAKEGRAVEKVLLKSGGWQEVDCRTFKIIGVPDTANYTLAVWKDSQGNQVTCSLAEIRAIRTLPTPAEMEEDNGSL
jgi:hypothetical protein